MGTETDFSVFYGVKNSFYSHSSKETPLRLVREQKLYVRHEHPQSMGRGEVTKYNGGTGGPCNLKR